MLHCDFIWTFEQQFYCISTVEAHLKKMWIQDDDKPERVQTAETSVSWYDLDEQKF